MRMCASSKCNAYSQSKCMPFCIDRVSPPCVCQAVWLHEIAAACANADRPAHKQSVCGFELLLTHPGCVRTLPKPLSSYFSGRAQIGRSPEHNQFVCGFGPLLTHPGCAVVLLADLGHAPLADRLRNETECSLDSRALDTWQVRRHAAEAQRGRNVPWKKLALETR